MLAGHLLKTKKKQKFKETGDSQYIYQNELDKTCFQQDMAYGDFKDLPGRAASDKVLCDKAFTIAENPKYNKYQHGLAFMVCRFFDKNTSVTNTSARRAIKFAGGALKSEIISNQYLAE